MQNFPTGYTPKRAPKGNYGMVHLVPVISLFDHVSQQHYKTVKNDVPLSFEDMDINHGLVLYETDLPLIGRLTKLPLSVNILRDRATVFLDNVSVHTFFILF